MRNIPFSPRDVATPQLALHLLGPPTNPKHDNWLDPSVKLGSKTTVGPGCIIGANTTVGDKGSVKRSVVGLDCKIGSNAKVRIQHTITCGRGLAFESYPTVNFIHLRCLAGKYIAEKLIIIVLCFECAHTGLM